MNALLQQVRRTILRHGLFPPGSRVLVGVSGGSDSVALLRVLLELGPSLEFAVVGASHFNHRLRPAADHDERFCRELAARLDVPFAAESADVAGYAATQQLSVEEAARRLRYQFLERAAAARSASRIAVGHTMDDQAETFVLKLIRGAGQSGLAGVYPRRGAIARPLLEVTRQDLRAWLERHGQEWVDDETNADVSNPRNRIRHRVLPELDAAYGGSTRASIARAAELAREDGQWLDELAAVRYAALVTRGQDCLQMDAVALLGEPQPVVRRIVLQAMKARAAGREVGHEHVELALAVLHGHARAADVPGSRWELRGRNLVLYDQGPSSK